MTKQLAYSVRDTAKMMGIDAQSVRRLLRENELTGYKMKQKVLVHYDSIMEYMNWPAKKKDWRCAVCNKPLTVDRCE